MNLLKGIVHGKTIELESDAGKPEGQMITVFLQKTLAPGEGIPSSAGTWADAGDDLEDWLVDIRKNREINREE